MELLETLRDTSKSKPPETRGAEPAVPILATWSLGLYLLFRVVSMSLVVVPVFRAGTSWTVSWFTSLVGEERGVVGSDLLSW